MTDEINKYRRLLNLDNDIKFIKIEHADAMVSNVYKIIRHNKPTCILKVCERSYDYYNEVYFLNYFNKKISVPVVVSTVVPTKEHFGAVLMEYLTGTLLTPQLITKDLAFDVGKSLALIHDNKTDGFGCLSRNLNLSSDPSLHFIEKFEEGIEECKNHLPKKLITQCCTYFNKSLSLLEAVDGPCIIHRDFRPGNIVVEGNRLKGIIDWSSAKASFADDDFCSIAHGEWNDFNGYKNNFLEGYSSIRAVPKYEKTMPLLRLSRAIAFIGFTVKRCTWNTTHHELYQSNKNFIVDFLK